MCARNENPPEPEPIRTTVKRVRANFLNSRKISLTCQSIRNPVLDSPQVKSERHLLDPTRKSGGRLRSPLPSPIPSPISSPIPSPSRSRFQVSRVVESTVSPITPPSSNSCSPTSITSTSRFRVTVVEPPTVMSAPVTIINSTNKEPSFSEKPQQKQTIVSLSPSDQPSIPQNKDADETIKLIAAKPTEQQIASTLTVVDVPANSSFDSPDLEVKGYMDDSCSSFSSLDSIDRGQDLNTSLSSMESYDILSGENKVMGECVDKSGTNDPSVKKTLSSLSIDRAESNIIHHSASSLEASTCSNDSIYGSQEFPVLKVSSNEGTLTNSPVSPCSGDIDKDSLTVKSDEKRVRKTSWISRSDAVPATLDKLLSIFHHPGNLFFTRSNNGEVIKKEAPQNPPQENKPPSRKESPMGGLFAWTKKENVFDEFDSRPPNAEPLIKVMKSPLQPNMSPENTITAESVTIESIPVNLKQDIKENISPEHTVTADSMANLQSKSIQTQTPIADLHPPGKVRFEVGGDEDEDDDENGDNGDNGDNGNDDDDDDDDDQNGTKNDNNNGKFAQDSSIARHSQTHTHNSLPSIGKALGLGQITRDSLSILKCSSNNSQDSMRSLDSLSEIVFEEEQLPPK